MEVKKLGRGVRKRQLLRQLIEVRVSPSGRTRDVVGKVSHGQEYRSRQLTTSEVRTKNLDLPKELR